MIKVNTSLAQTNAELQDKTDPDDFVFRMKNGYFAAVELMCSTMDYGNSIQMLSRVTKKLASMKKEPQETVDNIDIFAKIEKLSYDFVLRLRQHEMEHTHVEERL